MGGVSRVIPAPPARPTALLVLAAGASRRHGGRPKALLEVDGEAAVRRVLRVARSVGLEEAFVVVGPHRAPIAAALEGTSATLVANDAWERGRSGSIRVGVEAAGGGRGILLWPIDHPFAEANTVRELLATAARDRMAAWIVPTFEGKGGHPVWLGPPALRLLPTLAADEPLRSLLPRLGPQVVRMPTSDRWIRVGTDTMDEYAAAVAQRRSRE